MKEPENDDRTVMVGASFDEVAVEASIAIKREIDRQVQGHCCTNFSDYYMLWLVRGYLHNYWYAPARISS